MTRPPRAEAARLTAACAMATLAIGVAVIIGWTFGIETMQRAGLGTIHMLPITAVTFIVAAVSLLMQRVTARETRWRFVIARALALVVLAVGVVTLAERVFGWDAGIDTLFFHDTLARLPYQPIGRMATNSAVTFTLVGAALFLLDGQSRRVRQIAHWFSTLGIGIAMLALIGHLYGATALFKMDAAAAMAVSTACAFFTISVGILSARPNASWAGRIVSRTGTGMLARRLLVALTIVPVMLGWLFILAREQDTVSREVGMAIFVVVMMGIQLTVLVRAAAIVQRGERAQSLALEHAAAARDEAERANRAKNDFLAVMSHELRTPLNAIIGYGSLLRDGIPDPATPGQHKQIERIGASAKHLLALIDEVLTLSRLELGRERITPTTIGVAALVEEAAAMMEPEARKKGLTLLLAVPEPDVTMVTDAGKLRQALVNLLGNAVKFTDHGEVSIRARADTAVDEVVFEVMDTGIGISEEHLPRVFDAFWQVDQAPTRRVGGTGLGLHVTRRLVRLLGGDVSAHSVPGKGSCFTIRVSRSWWGATEDAHDVERTAAEVAASTG
ncbi:MAG TPA: ATP-binding protein [Gemmatimonadaceae bacterium]|nr:ATP-binding protein [Gemmatimonadaceae bacterium]